MCLYYDHAKQANDNGLVLYCTLIDYVVIMYDTSTCVKIKQFWGICIYIVSSSELARPSGRYTTSLGASKRF